jgi:hypothetical protein
MKKQNTAASATPSVEDELPDRAADIAAFREGVKRFTARTRQEEPLTPEEERELDDLRVIANRLNLGAAEAVAAAHPYNMTGLEKSRAGEAKKRLLDAFTSFADGFCGSHVVTFASAAPGGRVAPGKGRVETVPNFASAAIRASLGRAGNALLLLLKSLEEERDRVVVAAENARERRLALLARYLELPEARMLIEAYIFFSSDPRYANSISIRGGLKQGILHLGRVNGLNALILFSVCDDYRELQKRGAIR